MLDKLVSPNYHVVTRSPKSQPMTYWAIFVTDRLGGGDVVGCRALARPPDVMVKLFVASVMRDLVL